MRFRALLLRNLPAKLLSLFFAIVVWAVVIGEKKAQMQLNIPLELINIPEKAVVVSDVPARISVIVYGPRTLLRSLPERGIRKSIDLEGMGTGWTTIRILPDSISMPRGIEVVRVTPSTVSLNLEPLMTVRLQVVPQVIGTPPRRYRVAEVSVDPPQVLLKGGESELRDIHEVKTHPVTLPRNAKDIEERMGLELDGLHLVEVSPPTVWVRVKFAPILKERALKDIPVRSTPPEKSASIKPEKVEVLLRGPTESIEKLKGTDIKVSVDLQGLDRGVHRVTPKIIAPKGVRILKVVPPVLEITLGKPQDSERG